MTKVIKYDNYFEIIFEDENELRFYYNNDLFNKSLEMLRLLGKEYIVIEGV